MLPPFTLSKIGARKTMSNVHNFTFDDKNIEIVDEFKYLGIIFKYNGNFDLCKKNLNQQANKAMFSLLSKCNKLDLPLDIQLELFDRTIIPILSYGSEVWGYGNNNLIENIHLKFCRYILGVKNSTSKCMIYGELGRYPTDIIIKTRAIGYWCKLISGNPNKLAYKIYSVLLNAYCVSEYKSNWLSFIHKTLNECGMSDVWIHQGANMTPEYIKAKLSQTLKDQFQQQWLSELDNNSKCILYRAFKTEIGFEKYLVNLNKYNRKLIIKFRMCNHKLPVERGRYSNIERHKRYCDICNEEKLGDEFHLLLECKNTNIVDIRNRSINEYCNNVNMHTFINIMSSLSSDCTLACKIVKFLLSISRSYKCL